MRGWLDSFLGNEVVPPSEAELAAEVMQYQTLYKVRERRGTKDKRSSVGDVSNHLSLLHIRMFVASVELILNSFITS